MSGVCGLVHADGAPVDPVLLRAMAEASAYRGAAGIHYAIRDHVGLAQLASRRPSGAPRRRLPLESSDGELCITADARIDERAELIALLASKGHLRSGAPTDAALLLAAYRCWGEECPHRIVGDFAFAIWDRPRRRLFCARDVIGARLFHFAFDGATFRFASDPRQILADPRVSRDLDGYAVSDFLSSSFCLEPRTMFAEVRKLQPGHFLTLDRNGLQGGRYWTPDPGRTIHYPRDEEYVEHFRELLFRCVADRLRGFEGAAAVATSGGVDSSSLCVVAQELYRQGRVSTRPVGYTLGFDDRLKECDEREYSRTLVAERGLELQEILAEKDCSQAEMLEHAPGLDGPEMQHVGPIHEILRRAREQGCRVLLTGDGGDELFQAGKRQYVDHARSGRWWKLGPWLAAERREGRSVFRAAASLAVWPLLPWRLRYVLDGWMGGTRFARVPSWIDSELTRRSDRGRPGGDAAQAKKPRGYARRWHYDHIVGCPGRFAATLDLCGRSALEYRVEASYPFLDRRLLEFALAVPLRLCARPGRHQTKWLLRRAMKGLLPEKIRLRRSKGGGGDTYLRFIFCRRNGDEIRRIFSDTNLARLGLVDGNGLIAAFSSLCDSKDGNQGVSELLLPLWMEMWLRAHGLGQSPVRFVPWELPYPRPSIR